MKIILDTNRYCDFVLGTDQVTEVLELAELIYVPFAVLAELRAGFARGRRGEENERILKTFLQRKDVQPLYPDAQTTFHYAQLNRQLREQGTPIPINDLWIASLAVQHNLTLFAIDKHFDNLPQLARI